MLPFDDRKIIQTAPLFRVENISATAGNRVIEELEDEGLIDPEVSPTGRKKLSIREARIVDARINGVRT